MDLETQPSLQQRIDWVAGVGETLRDSGVGWSMSPVLHPQGQLLLSCATTENYDEKSQNQTLNGNHSFKDVNVVVPYCALIRSAHGRKTTVSFESTLGHTRTVKVPDDVRNRLEKELFFIMKVKINDADFIFFDSCQK